MSWTLIESQTLGSSQASVTLGSGGSLPQTYKTLKLLVSVRHDGGSGIQIGYRFNGDTGSNYSRRLVFGDGSTSASASGASETYARFAFTSDSTGTANTFGNAELNIPNYAGSTNKATSSDGVGENNATLAYQGLHAGLWSTTAAITSITVVLAGTGNLLSGSTFTLYGLK